MDLHSAPCSNWGSKPGGVKPPPKSRPPIPNYLRLKRPPSSSRGTDGPRDGEHIGVNHEILRYGVGSIELELLLSGQRLDSLVLEPAMERPGRGTENLANECFGLLGSSVWPDQALQKLAQRGTNHVQPPWK